MNQKNSLAMLAVGLGTALAIGSAELFLRVSGGDGVLRASILAMGLIAFWLLAAPQWSRTIGIARLAGSLIFAAFIANAAWRFPGLTKSRPPEPSVTVGLFLKALVAFLLVIVVLTLLRQGTRLLTTSWKKGRRGADSSA